MPDQAAPGTMADTEPHGRHPRPGQVTYEHEAHHGRPASWATTVIVITGFIVGGIALPAGPAWWLFWTGAGIVVLGIITGAAVHIFDDWY